MPDFLDTIVEKLKKHLGSWASFTALGSFLLYLLGYLSTRFYLTVLGVGTDLSVVDERYFFAGAKFLVYLFSTVPVLVMIGLVPMGLVALLISVFKFRSRNNRNQKGKGVTAAKKQWFSDPTIIAVLGILISVLFIQIVMRKCFMFSNLLVKDSLPNAGLGLEQLLLEEDSLRRYLFFVILVGGTIVTGALWLYARTRPSQNLISKSFVALLALLVLIQFLFLPINYGIFIQDRYIPRVTDLGDQMPLPPGQKAWLVWEGTQTVTYFVQEASSVPTPAPTSTPTPAPKATCRHSSTAAPTRDRASAIATNSPSTSTESPSSAGNAPATASSGAQASPNVPAMDSQPSPLGRKLVSVQQKDLKRTTIVKYDQLLKHIFAP